MKDISKISEVRSVEDGEPWDEWPYPTITITSLISGELRSRVLMKIGADDGRITIVETEVSGGYSEYTQETDYGIELFHNDNSVWKAEYTSGGDTAMAAFLRWVEA